MFGPKQRDARALCRAHSTPPLPAADPHPHEPPAAHGVGHQLWRLHGGAAPRRLVGRRRRRRVHRWRPVLSMMHAVCLFWEEAPVGGMETYDIGRDEQHLCRTSVTIIVQLKLGAPLKRSTVTTLSSRPLPDTHRDRRAPSVGARARCRGLSSPSCHGRLHSAGLLLLARPAARAVVQLDPRYRCGLRLGALSPPVARILSYTFGHILADSRSVAAGPMGRLSDLLCVCDQKLLWTLQARVRTDGRQRHRANSIVEQRHGMRDSWLED